MTPDDIFAGARPIGDVTVFDDDHYYMGPLLAVLLAQHGASVAYVTTASRAGDWSHYTGEQQRTQQQLLELGIEVIVSTSVEGFDGESVSLGCVYSGRRRRRVCSLLLLVTSREPEDVLYRQLAADDDAPAAARVRRIGDRCQPALIAHAVYAGHKAARELGEAPEPPRRERSLL